MPAPDLRASDADRQRVVDALERHTAAGRLTLDEYAERVDLALAARTHADLTRITQDLPEDAPVADPAPVGAERPEQGRQLLLAFLLALLALAVIGVLVAVGR
jgi:hypothetical protein